jgi:predicted RNase H-like HicB family nuclease
MAIQWSNATNEYKATILELPTCKASGDTYEEAAKNGREALEEYLAQAQENGETYDIEEKVTIETALDDINALTQRIEKALTYPAKLPTRKKVLQGYAEQLKEAVLRLEDAIDET